MKLFRLLSMLICTLILMTCVSFAAPEADFKIGSQSAVLMDIGTGQIIYSKNPDSRQSPAGLVKIMASLLAMENADLDAMANVSGDAVLSVAGTNTLGLAPGETFTIREMLYGMLMQSSNDCAMVVAENVEESSSAFVSKMNEKAKSLGCSNTNFTNVTGLYDLENYSTAKDMATIVAAAYENPNFVEIASTVSYKIPATSVAGERTLNARCPLLGTYKNAKTGIAGYTDEGGYAMAVTASKNNLNLVCVVMNAPDEKTRNDDCINLLDYGFENYQTFKITPEEFKIDDAKLMGVFGKIGTVTFNLDNPVSILAPIEATFENLQFQPQKTSYRKNDEMAGTVSVLYNDEVITELNLTGTPKKKITFYSVIKVILLVILIVVLLFVGLCAYYIYDAERKKKKRRQEKLKRTLRIKKDI